MNKIKNGDIVVRKSYNKDIIFMVKDVRDKNNIILKGLFERIIADSDISDLEIVDQETLNIRYALKEMEIRKKENRIDENGITGKILHLDGDKKYSEKSFQYYQRMGIHAIVKNIPENRQSKYVYHLLKYYKPDILVITRS